MEKKNRKVLTQSLRQLKLQGCHGLACDGSRGQVLQKHRLAPVDFLYSLAGFKIVLQFWKFGLPFLCSSFQAAVYEISFYHHVYSDDSDLV